MRRLSSAADRRPVFRAVERRSMTPVSTTRFPNSAMAAASTGHPSVRAFDALQGRLIASAGAVFDATQMRLTAVSVRDIDDALARVHVALDALRPLAR